MTTETKETLRQKANAAVAAALGDAYDCKVDWSEWEYETIDEGDFSSIKENQDRVAEITDAALDAVEFDDILEELEELRAECYRLGKAINEAAHEIRYAIKEMEQAA